LAVWWVQYAEYTIDASRLSLSSQPIAGFGLFVFIVIINALVGILWPGGGLRPPELLVVFAAGFAATPLTSSNLMDWIFSAVAVPFYLATPENRWADLLLPHLKGWWVVEGPATPLRWAFVGMPPGQSVPWGIWVVPLFWWSSFLAALMVVCVSISVFLRRQWVDHERLVFPLVQLPTELLERPGGRFRMPAMLRSRIFWMGAAVPLVIILWNVVGYFVHGFPRISLMDARWLTISRHFPPVYTKINVYAMGFAFLVNTEILLSVWIFYVLGWLQIGASNYFGFTLGSSEDLMSSRDAITSWLGFGAMAVLVVWGLWMARRHLAAVLRTILKKGDPLDDSKELLPFRWAAVGLFAGLLYMAGWLHAQGMTWTVIALFLFGTGVANLGLARLVAQTGLIYVRAPLTANVFALHTLGAGSIPPAALAALGGAYAVTAFNKGMFLPHVMHLSKLAPSIGRLGRQMMKVLVAATVVGMLVGFVYTISESYRIGSTAFGGWAYPKHGLFIYGPMVKHMEETAGPDLVRLTCLGIGSAVMSGLLLAYYRIPWWPLHPYGLPMYVTWNTEITALSIFLVWLIKRIILRIGGMPYYEKAKPFFIGIPVGYALGVSISFVVDLIWFPGAGNGHRLHEW
jgi:hypothetical protein